MDADRMKRNLCAFCAVPSVSHTPGERLFAPVLRSALEEIPYFQRHPEEISVLPVSAREEDGEMVFALMRAPGGMETGYVKHEIGYPLIHWSLASRDSGSEDYKRIANYVCYNIDPGDIVLMHDLNPYSPRYAGLILERLCDQGYLFVTVEELFAQAGIELEPNVVYYCPNREPVRPETE